MGNKFTTKAAVFDPKEAFKNTLASFGVNVSKPSFNINDALAIVEAACKAGEAFCTSIEGISGAFRHNSTRPKPHLNPAALRPPAVFEAYNFPAPGVDIANQHTAIIELGGGYFPLDVENYCKKMGVAAPQLEDVSVDGATNSPSTPDSSDGEVLLDIEIVACAAPGSKISVLFAPNTDQGFIDALLKVPTLSPKPGSVSISWGAPEDQWEASSITAMVAAIDACEAAGIPVLVAAGDNGSSDGESTGVHVDFPGSAPNAISCGGTRLILTAAGVRSSEEVWDPANGNGATGGGNSTQFATPTYQQALRPVGGILGKRMVPDVAGNADPMSGYDVSIDFVEEVIGGTSAVAPLYAGLIALLNSNLKTPVGSNFKELLYAAPDCFYDVNKGSNGAFKAGSGYDLCTGRGVVDGKKFLAFLQSKETAA